MGPRTAGSIARQSRSSKNEIEGKSEHDLSRILRKALPQVAGGIKSPEMSRDCCQLLDAAVDN